MAGKKDEHSISSEPHLQPGRTELDPAEEKVRRKLEREAAKARQSYRVGESVYDEPDILPGRGEDAIGQDWSCSECGYNLRGLPPGHPCPECGHRELYRPPPSGAHSYQTWMQAHLAETRARTGWVVAAFAALAGGLWAVLASVFGQAWGTPGGGSVILAIGFGPVIEETMKIAAAAYVIELRPYLFRRIEQLQLATVGAAAVFAVIENLIYLYIYFPGHTDTFALWRWTVCVALHVGCTTVASRGLIEPWRQAVHELRQPRITQGLRMLVLAILLHGAYNASVYLYELGHSPIR